MLFVEKAGSRRRQSAETEYERAVDAAATGYAVARSAKAQEAWERRRRARHGTPAQTVGQYRATLARLGALGLAQQVH